MGKNFNLDTQYLLLDKSIPQENRVQSSLQVLSSEQDPVAVQLKPKARASSVHWGVNSDTAWGCVWV